MKQKTAVRRTIDGVLFVLGSALFALSVNCFTAPNGIAPGGLTGAAVLIRALTGLPIGLMTLVLNIPLFFWGFRVLGGRAMLKSAVTVVLCSVMLDLTALFVPSYQGDLLLAAIFGGVCAGAGLALIFMRGGTTGGTDLAASLIGRHMRHVSLGRLIMVIDLPIVLASIPVFGSIESPMYALITIFITTKVIDAVLYGTDAGTGKLLFIISQQGDRIGRDILSSLPRGVTLLRGQGGYSGEDTDVLLCAVRRPEVYRTYDLIYAADPDAFIIVAETSEITGEGFRPPQKK